MSFLVKYICNDLIKAYYLINYTILFNLIFHQLNKFLISDSMLNDHFSF